ncbi:MAG: Ni/Fe-hydrogenase subunit HybB-like protein [Lentimonas sp.]|jgi:Ni/Fe-hydrogenase subunit HybB-like protein
MSGHTIPARIMIPGIGKFNFPVSMLTSDVIVLNGYLLINMHICGYLLDMRFLGEKPNSKWYVPFVFISIFWAISIHTVTTFLYSGLGGRPRWNTALLAPRFLTSAFVAGPGFIIVALTIIRKVSNFHVGDGAIKILANIIPEFIPSTLHEIVEYLPDRMESLRRHLGRRTADLYTCTTSRHSHFLRRGISRRYAQG